MAGLLLFTGGLCILVGVGALLSFQVDNLLLGFFCLAVGSIAFLRGLIR